MKRLLFLLAAVFLMLLGAAQAEAMADDVFADASWIWTESCENNQWIYLRRSLTLDTVPDTAPACLSAADRYWLYVNGTPVVMDGSLKRGENDHDGYYDVVDLAPYLVPGENTLAVRVWFWGRREAEESTSHAFAAHGGFLFACDSLGLVSDSSWKAYHEQAYISAKKANPWPRSCLPEYNVCYDAGEALPGHWQQADTAAWSAAVCCGRNSDAVFGSLTPRPIPLFAFGELTDFTDSAQWIGHRTEGKEDITVHLPENQQFTVYLEVDTTKSRKITIMPNNCKQSNLTAAYITAKTGVQAFECPAWLNGDSVTFSIPGGVTILALQYRPTRYDTQVTGSFTMGSEVLDELYRMGVRTQLVCMRDTFMDCPDRERAQWWGDATNQMQQTLYCMDDAAWALYEKGLKQKLGWRHGSAFQTIVPSEENSELPIQELGGIVGTWTYYLYTGKAEIVDMMVDAYLDYLRLWDMQADGLVCKRDCSWAQTSWYDAYTDADEPVLENAWYYWAADAVCRMAELTGREHAWLSARMESIAAAFDQAFLTPEGYRSAGQAAPDDRANAIAVLSGLARPESYGTVRRVLTTTAHCGTFMELYVEKALCEMGYTADAIARMQTRYTPMVRENLATGCTTLWEYWERASGTENHAWSAGPVVILPAYAAGIRPVAPGYETCVVAPDLSLSPAIDACVPTVKGLIRLHAAYDNGICRAELTLPEGCAAAVTLPGAAAVVNGQAAEAAPADGKVTLTLAGGQTYVIDAMP